MFENLECAVCFKPEQRCKCGMSHDNDFNDEESEDLDLVGSQSYDDEDEIEEDAES